MRQIHNFNGTLVFRNYYFAYSSKFGAKIQITIVYNKKKNVFF